MKDVWLADFAALFFYTKPKNNLNTGESEYESIAQQFPEEITDESGGLENASTQGLFVTAIVVLHRTLTTSTWSLSCFTMRGEKRKQNLLM
jgi:hypothetical protein